MRDVEHPRHTGLRRYFWLLDHGVQLVYEAFGWSNDWYVDVVAFRHSRVGDAESIAVTDQMIDIVVHDNGPSYRVLDLDEFADATECGRLTPAEAADALRKTHRFLGRVSRIMCWWQVLVTDL